MFILDEILPNEIGMRSFEKELLRCEAHGNHLGGRDCVLSFIRDGKIISDVLRFSMEQRTHAENIARECIKARAAMSYLFVEVHRLLSSLVQTCLITD